MKTLEKIAPKRRTINVIETSYEITSEVEVSDDHLNSMSSFSYDLSLRYIGGGVFTNWEKSNFKINGKKSFTKIDEIYLTTSKPVNKLHFFFDKGRITEVKNHKEILEEWELCKEQVISEFYGEVLNTIIDVTDRNYNDEKRLCSLLSRDLVLQHLYTSTDLNDELIYMNSSTNKRTFLGVFDQLPATYNEKQELSEIGKQLRIKTFGKQKVNGEVSTELNKYFKSKVENFDIANLQSTIKGDYIFDPESLWMNEAVAVHDVEVVNSNYRKIITLRINRK